MKLSRMTVFCYAQGWTLWAYRHPGTFAECEREGFWRDMGDLVHDGDLVAVRANDASGLRTLRNRNGHIWLERTV